MAFSLILLNTDRHNPAIPENKKMTFPQFLRNNSGLWDGEDPPIELQEQLFNAIVNEEIVIKKQGDPDKRGWIKGIRGEYTDIGRRWLVLKNNELRWYKNPSQGEDRGIGGRIVLDYVRILEDGSTGCMTVTGVLPNPIDYYIYDKHKMVKEDTMELQFFFENEQQLSLWVVAVNLNVTFKTIPKFDRKQFRVRHTTKRHGKEIAKVKF